MSVLLHRVDFFLKITLLFCRAVICILWQHRSIWLIFSCTKSDQWQEHLDSFSLCLPGLSCSNNCCSTDFSSFLSFFFCIMQHCFCFSLEPFVWYHHTAENPNPCISECQEFCYLMLPPFCSLLGLMAALVLTLGGYVEEVRVGVGSKAGSGCLHIPGNHRSASLWGQKYFPFHYQPCRSGVFGHTANKNK